MARIVRQRYTFFALAGRRVPKGTPGAVRESRESAKWYGEGIPGLPPEKRVPLAVNRRVAEAMLADLVAAGERGVNALPDPGEAGRPLAPLVEEFGEYLTHRDRTAKHVRNVIARVRRVVAGCRLVTVADLRRRGVAARVESFTWSMVRSGEVVAPTAAYHGKQFHAFARWLWQKKHLLDSDPLAGIELPSQETDEPRRALSAAEVADLVGAADASPRAFRGLAGPARAVLYLTAVATGFRVGELAALTPARFDLDAEVPAIRLDRRQAKNRKAALQPLPPAVAGRVRAYLAGRPAHDPAWPGTWHERSNEMFLADLAAAGVPVEVGGEAASFHGLRHSFTTFLAATAPVRVTQELARHSTPALTIGRYTHTTMGEKAEAVARLPLPGAAAADPLAGMTRADLVGLVAGLVGLVALLTGRLTGPDDPAGPDGIRGDTTGGTGGRKGKHKNPRE